jgi:hypothetical protein
MVDVSGIMIVCDRYYYKNIQAFKCIEATVMNKMGSHWYMSPWLVIIICHWVYGNVYIVYVTILSTAHIPQIINQEVFVVIYYI